MFRTPRTTCRQDRDMKSFQPLTRPRNRGQLKHPGGGGVGHWPRARTFQKAATAGPYLEFRRWDGCSRIGVAARCRQMGRDGRDRAGQASHHEGCLHPRIEWIGEAPEKAKMDHLHHEAHEVCFIANSVKTLVTVA